MGFERCHPAVNLLYFAAVITGTIAFQHPVFLAISYTCALLYSIKRNGRNAVVLQAVLLLGIAAYAFYYSTYHHFGVTVLFKNQIGNRVTLESFLYGIVLGVIASGVILWFSCVFSVFTTDKVVYLLGKVSPRLSLFLAILLRMIPRILQAAKRIHQAQKGIGKGIGQGSVFQRMHNGLHIFSMVITWTIESMTNASESMQSRGSGLHGRTAFSIYRFDNRDRAYVIGMFTCLTATLMAVLLRQTRISYNPRILMNPVTSMSFLFYAGYALLCLMPMGLELWTQYRFRRATRGL